MCQQQWLQVLYKIEELHEYSLIYESVKEFQILIATSLLLFFVGVKDDIIGTAPVNKLLTVPPSFTPRQLTQVSSIMLAMANSLMPESAKG